MKLDKGNHKLYLWYLFNPLNAQGGRDERKFPLAMLADASGAIKKLIEGNTTKGDVTTFSDKAVEFTVGEATLLKNLVDEITEATLSEKELIEELKEVLK